MTFAEMKKLLLQYPDTARRIYNLQEEIKNLKLAANGTREEIRSPAINGMPHGSGISDNTYQKVQKVIDDYDTRVALLMNDISYLQEQQAKLFDLLKQLNRDEYKIIELRYLKGLRWEHLPSYAHWSRAHCFRIHDEAVNKLIRLCDVDTK